MNFETAFRDLADGREPYPYQQAVGGYLFERRNLIVRAPTGAGKTLAVLAPFFYDRLRIGVRRLIYCLPLRTLASGVYEEARKRCPSGMQVTMQTGEAPGDPYFASGDIIVTTYDQLLSGMLCGPYGLGPRRYNLNAAAAAGNLIVFDEFHLMETSRAFLTAVAYLGVFNDVTRSVWMTATATEPLCGLLRETFSAVEVSLSSTEEQALHEGRGIRRAVRRELGSLTPEEIVRFAGQRTLVVVNSVRRAQKLYLDLHERMPELPLLLLHARFFQYDRIEKQRRVNEWFGKEPRGSGVVIATQVVEAGLDLGCDHLLTEMCPVNAFVQRAGRCARFPGQSGTVHVYDVPAGGERPYEHEELDAARTIVLDTSNLTPLLARKWVGQAHALRDANELESHPLPAQKRKCFEYISSQISGTADSSPAELIREGSDTVRVLILDVPDGVRPATRESISMYRNSVESLSGWRFDPEAASLWIPATGKELTRGYVVALPRLQASYTAELGLQLGSPGEIESPLRRETERLVFSPIRRETWMAHSKAVARRADELWAADGFEEGLLFGGLQSYGVRESVRCAALLHDLGKLQETWQRWARAYQIAVARDGTPDELLAHTDFDPANPQHRAIERTVQPKRPHHAEASAYYASCVLPAALGETEAIAVIGAILSHHGGWWNRPPIEPLAKGSDELLRRLGFPSLPKGRDDFLAFEQDWLEPLVAELDRYWLLTAYLMRIVRLADQRATEETNTQ